jgi:chitinase
MNMGDEIFLGGLIENINNIKNVLNVIDLKIYNKVGNGYSLNETTMSYIDNDSKQINPVDYSLFCESDSIFEIKNPQNDIVVTIKKKQGRFIV